MSRRLLTGLALFAALSFPSAAVAQSVGSGEVPATRMNFKRIGQDPLFARGMNAAAAAYHNYLYIGNRTDLSFGHPHPGLLVVDISRPSRPRVVRELAPEPPGQTTRELRVWPQEQLLIVMIFRCAASIHACPASAPLYSLKFYDLKEPSNPRLITNYVPSFQPHEMFLWVDPKREGRALLYRSTPSASADPNRANLVVTDISRWRENVFPEVAKWTLNPDFTPEQRAALDVALHSMSVTNDGKRMYVAYLGGGFFVADTSDLANAVASPQIRALTPVANTPRWPNQTVHSAIPLPGRTFALATDELYGDLLDNADNDHGCPWGWMHSIDVRDPANPRLVGEYRTNANTPEFCSTPQGQDDVRASYTAHNPTVYSNLALITWHGSGLQAIDVTDPTAPRQAGWFTPKPLPVVSTEDPALTTTGNKVSMWSFPIVKNGLIWVVDIRNGLYVLRYRGPGWQRVDKTIFREGNSNLNESCSREAGLVPSDRLRRWVVGQRLRPTYLVRSFGHRVEKAIVTARGAGVRQVRVTGRSGLARFAFAPRRPGLITFRAVNVNKHCSSSVRVRAR